MLSSTLIASLNEAYKSIYEDLVEEDFDFDLLDEFDDDEIEEIVEEVVYQLFDEGYEVDEIESLFESTFLAEGRVDMAARAKARREYARSSEKSAREARKKGASVVRKEKRAEKIEKVKGAAKGALEKLKSFGRKAKETVKGAASDAKSSVEKGARKAAKQATVGAEKVKRAASGEDRDVERGRRQSKIKMKKTAVANIRKAVTGKSEGPARRRDETGSTGAGAAGTIRSKSGGSGDGPSSKGRALPPKGATSRTDAGNPRRSSQITFALAKAQKSGEKKLQKLNNSFDAFDLVIEFLCDYGIAENLQEAQWLMVNEIDSEDVATILEAYGLDELYKGKHGQSEKEYQAGRSDAGKRISGDEQTGPRYYTLGRSRGVRPDAPTAPGAKPKNTPKLATWEKDDIQYRKANLKRKN